MENDLNEVMLAANNHQDYEHRQRFYRGANTAKYVLFPSFYGFALISLGSFLGGNNGAAVGFLVTSIVDLAAAFRASVISSNQNAAPEAPEPSCEPEYKIYRFLSPP